eukprot:g5120.t1
MLFKVLVEYRLQREYCASTPKEDLLTSYDFLIVGGGTAGAALAADLSDSEHSVLLLEAGPCTNTGLSTQTLPGLCSLIGSSVDWSYSKEPQKNGGVVFNNRSIPIPRGRVLGGSNELNFMLHVRGTPKDYDMWAEMVEDDSWNSTEMAKMEDIYEDHIHVTRKRLHPMAKLFLEASRKTPYGVLENYNDRTTEREGSFVYQHGTNAGVRQSTARNMLLPRMNRANGGIYRANLHLLTSCVVKQVVLEKDEGDGEWIAKGVRVVLDGVETTIYAKKEVVLSAGAYGTPHLLQLSGIGAFDHLEMIDGVTPRVHLPGVGSHLQEHFQTYIKLRIGDGSSWFPRTATALHLPGALFEWLLRGTGLLATSNVEIGFFGASNPTFKGRPDLQLHGLMTAHNTDFLRDFLKVRSEVFDSEIGQPSDYSDLWSEGLLVTCANLHPEAEGVVRARTADIDDKPEIRYEAFSNANDVDRILKCVRRLEGILRKQPLRDLPLRLLEHHELAKDFGSFSDDYWRQYIRNFSGLIYHPTGTARMGKAGDPRSVVDTKLRVLGGVRGLRVADASVMPEITSGNTNVPSAAIGLKASKILRETYGGSGSDDDIDRETVSSKTTDGEEKKIDTKKKTSDVDVVSAHINARFDLLAKILRSDKTKWRVRVPPLGAGIAKGAWGGARDPRYIKIASLLATRIESLVDEFGDARVTRGFVGDFEFAGRNCDRSRKRPLADRPGNAAGQPNTWLDLWGANAGNWNPQPKKGGSWGAGQASCFDGQRQGIFGVATMPSTDAGLMEKDATYGAFD